MVSTSWCSYICCAFLLHYVFVFKQKTAYEMRISDWSSDVCSSDLRNVGGVVAVAMRHGEVAGRLGKARGFQQIIDADAAPMRVELRPGGDAMDVEIGRASCRERVCQYV